jgi:hypothetical protein
MSEKFGFGVVMRVYLVNHDADVPTKCRPTSEETYSVLFVDAYNKD